MSQGQFNSNRRGQSFNSQQEHQQQIPFFIVRLNWQSTN
jgi:hypothetical protein